MSIELKKILQILLVLFGLLPIMPNALTGILPLFLFGTSLVFFLRRPSVKPDWKLFLLNASLFITYVITFLYSENLSYAFRKIGPYTWALAFPLIFFIFLKDFKIEKKTVNSFIILFNISTIIYASICLVYIFSDALSQGQWKVPPIYEIRGVLEGMPFIGRHPIYIGIFIGISILLLTKKLLTKSNKVSSNLLFYAFSVLFLGLFLLLIQAKAAIFFLMPPLILLILQQLKNKKKGLAAILSLVLLFSLFLWKIPDSFNRFGELFDADTYQSESINQYNSSQIRLEIWKASIVNIKKAPFLGHGLGDVQQELNRTYVERSPILAKESYNSHNQYLGIWLVSGIIGVVIFFNFLYRNSLAFWRQRHCKAEMITAFVILIFFVLNFLTENVLDRQLGSLTFFFFMNFFGAVGKYGHMELEHDSCMKK